LNQELDNLSCFFAPSSIAIVGASRNEAKPGYGILKNVISSYQKTSKIYPINPFAEEILGLRVYSSLLEIKDEIDLVIVFISPSHIPGLIEQCSKKGVRGVIIESAGFAEVGTTGLQIQNEIKRLGDKHNIRIWGGNCMGTITDELITTFEIIGEDIKKRGGLSVVGQSGYFSGAVILQLFTERFLGIRKACSIGNRIDIDETDLLSHFLKDRQTKVAAFYLEGLK
jgi:acetyltransferase